MREEYFSPYACKSSMAVRTKKENWKKLEAEISRRVAERDTEIADEIVKKRIEVNKRHIRVSDRVLDILEQVLAAEGFTKDKLVSAKLKALADTLQTCQKTQRTALNMDEIKVEQKEPEITVIKGIDLDGI